jgi:exonuclease III
LVNIHTDPDEVKTELPVMHTVLKGIRQFEYMSAQEDDVLLMGDLNAGPKQFGELGRIPQIYWTVDNEFTNTIRKSIYDNILFDRGLTNEFTGRSGVLDLCDMFSIKTEEALRISDHLPIWAEFTAVEQVFGVNTAFGDGNLSPSRR